MEGNSCQQWLVWEDEEKVTHLEEATLNSAEIEEELGIRLDLWAGDCNETELEIKPSH